MCGFAGILNLDKALAPPDRVSLSSMIGVLSHRGPDEYGIYRDAQLGLVHARLSIVDLQSGQQPMCAHQSKVWIAFNGEIFNFPELRRELQAMGYYFATQSDTEVILQAWRAWGERAFLRFNGQWAVAIWDAGLNKLVLARDPNGVCPLHWAAFRGRLYFGSEIKAIFAANVDIPRAFDSVGLDRALTFWTTVAPRTVFQGVHELEPGHVRTFESGQVRDVDLSPPWFYGKAAEFKGDLQEAVGAVESALTEAVEMRMLRADVPVGSYLSGGLDSSIVAALGKHFSRGQFQTFSLRFDDPEFDETQYQRRVASHLGSQHHEILVSQNDIASALPEAIFHGERPILRSAPVPLFLLSRLVRSHGIKVVLTGEGADEVFAGYDLFREGKVRRFWARQPESQIRPALLERLYPYLARSPSAIRAQSRQFFGRDLEQSLLPGFAHGTRWRTTAALKRLLRPEMQIPTNDPLDTIRAHLPSDFSTWNTLTQDQFIEAKTLLAGYLLSSQGDRVLLGNSVEGRFPFLDANVMALAHTLPTSYKLCGLNEKHVLKKMAKDLIPDEVVQRTKQPYRAPDSLCFIGAQAPEYVRELLSESTLRAGGVFDPSVVTQLHNKCTRASGKMPLSNSDNMAMMAVISTQFLHMQFIANRPTSNANILFKTDIDLVRA